MHKSLIIIIFFLPIIVIAQPSIERSVVNAGGSYSEAGSVSISSSIGEAFVTTIEAGTIILTQGFQQSTSKPLSVDFPEWNANLTAYPNPVENTIKFHLTLNDEYNGLFTFELIDITGKVLLRNEGINVITEHIEEIDMSELRTGTYFIRIRNKKIIKNIKIIKE